MPNNQSLDPLEIVNTNNDPIAEAINSVSPQAPTAGPTDSVAMSTETPSYQGVGLADLEATRRAGQTFGLDQEFVQRDQEAREFDLNDQGLKFEAGIGEDLYQDYDPQDQFTKSVFGDYMRSGAQSDFRNLVDQGTANRLAEQGLQPFYELDKYRGYQYQPDTGEYKYYDNTPSMIETAVPALIKAGVMTAATAGLGGAFSAGLGVSASTGAGLAAGSMSLAQGDSLDEAIVKGFTAGLSEYAEGATGALEAAEAAGESAEVIKGLQAASDVANNVKNVVNIGRAIESGNILGGLSSGMELAGIGSLVDYTEDVIAESLGETAGMGIDGALTEWAFYNSDHLAEATVKVADSLIKGDSIGEATVDSVIKYFEDGGGLKDLMPSGGDFSIDFETPEVIQQIAQIIADGASAINRNVIKPAIEGADQLVRDLPTTKEDWQEAEDYVNDNIIDPTVDTVREFGRDVRDALPEGPDLDFPDFDFPSLSGGQYVGGGGYSGDKADLVTVQLTDPELVKGFEYDSLNNPLMNRRAI